MSFGFASSKAAVESRSTIKDFVIMDPLLSTVLKYLQFMFFPQE
jgi:hypothetical protein